MEENEKKPCPVCGALELNQEGFFEICHVCGWEDDIVSRENPDGLSAHPTLSLNQARKAWKKGKTIWPNYPNPNGK